MNEKVIEFIKQHPRLVAAQDFEIVVQQSTIQGARFFEGKEGLKSEDLSYWVLLRALHRNKPGFAYSTVVSEESLNKLVEAALQSAEQSQPDPWFRFPILSNRKESVEVASAPPEDFWRTSFDWVGSEKKPFKEEYEWWRIKTSLFRRSDKSIRSFSHSVAKQTWSLGKVHETFWGLQNRQLRLEGLKKAVEVLDQSSDWKGAFPDWFSLSPRALEPILQKVGSWFLADNVRRQKSPLILDEKDQSLAADCLSISDDGLCPDSPFAGQFDLDGINPQTTALIQKGRVQNLLYDAYHGGIDNRRSTGNNNRDLESCETQLKNRYIQVQSGTDSSEQIWQKIDSGLQLEGWLQIDFPSFRRLSGLGYGWIVEKNKEKIPVRVSVLDWDLPELLQKASVVSSDSISFGLTKSPTTFFRGHR